MKYTRYLKFMAHAPTWLCVGAVLFACKEKPSVQQTLYVTVPPEHSHVQFENKVYNEKDFNILNYRNFYNGGGVGLGDINNDGLPDIFLVSNMADNKLYLNKGNFEFEDITEKAGVKGKHAWSTGVTFADINNDGFLDIYVCNSGNRNNDDRSNELFINNGNGTFTESAKQYGLNDGGFSTHAAFFDYDRDGDLDAYILNNSFIPISKLSYRNLRNQRDSLGGHKLLRNDDGVFTDVSEKAGIYGSIIGFGLGATVGDVNNDNWPDLYVSNDFYEHDYLYINNQNGTFTESLESQMGHTSLASMGADLADINNDGALDLFVTDMLPGDEKHLKQTMTFENYDLYALKLSRDYHHQITQNTLQLNNQDGTFSEVSRLCKVEATDWSWGALVFDMDGDGWKDIFVANGIAKDLTDLDFLKFFADETRRMEMSQGGKIDYDPLVAKMPSRPVPNYAFKNMTNLGFENRSSQWGLEGPGFSNGSAYGDLDNDGDPDLVVNNVNSIASIFRNTAADHGATRFLKIRLEGPAKNKFGIGAKIKVYRKGSSQFFEEMPNRGFQSSVDYSMIVGLGNDPGIDSLQVIWPDDRMQTLRNITAQGVLTIRYQEADNRWHPKPAAFKKYFTDVTAKTKLDYIHKENHYVDYYRDPLLKKMYSTQGPGLAAGDVNGDGLEDVIFGGASGQSLSLYLQQKNSTFIKKTQAIFDTDSLSEDVSLCLFDADNDHDLDLYVVTGSNEFRRDDPLLADRLYVNDGKGIFSRSNGIPTITGSGSCVAPGDFDHDGDIDLFVGGRLIPGQYGYDPPSYLLVNNGKGEFKNYTTRFLSNNQPGMVTDAAWADIDGDSFPELIVAGDWMSIIIYKNQSGKSLVPGEPVPHLEGWWNCIHAADVDQDGDIDIIAGNEGLNTRIRADNEHPAELYCSDFDNNGAVEQIITCVAQDGKNYPMVLKHDLERQLPVIKKRFVMNDLYAGKTMPEIFTPEELKKATHKQVYQPQTGVLLNDGKGTFSWKPFPLAAQFSPVHALETMDVDADGKTDIVLAGNFYDVLPELGRYDASYGLLLRGIGNGEFEPLLPAATGFFVTGQVRKMKMITTQHGRMIIAAKNNEKVQVLSNEQKQ